MFSETDYSYLMLSIGKQLHVALRPKLTILKSLVVGRIAYKTFLVKQMSEPESQARSPQQIVSVLRSEMVSTDSWHRLEK